MRKLLAMLLAAVMLAALLPTAFAAEELEEYRITMVRWGDRTTSIDETEIGKMIYDKLKIALDFVPYSGNWTEYCALRLAGKDYPEVMYAQDANTTQAYIDAGALLSFDDYAEYLPDFFAHYTPEGVAEARKYSPDGKMYFFVRVGGATNLRQTGMNWFVRSDLLEEQGWPYICTASEWVEFFKTAKANHPTTDDGLELFVDPPLGETWGITTLFNNFVYELRGDYIWAYDRETFTMTDGWDTQEQYEVFKFWNELWRNNLLDPETFTDKTDQVVSKGNTTQLMAGWYTYWDMDTINPTLIEKGLSQYQYVDMPFTVECMKDVPIQVAEMGNSLMTTGYGNFMVTKNCKQPERLFGLINYLHSDEGYRLHNFGVEGVDWYLNEETGLVDATPELVDLYVNDRDAYNKKGFCTFGDMGVNYDNYLDPHTKQPSKMSYTAGIQAVSYTDRQLEAVEKICGGQLPCDVYGEGVYPRPYKYVETKDVPFIDIPGTEEDLVDLYDEIYEYSIGQIARMIMADTEEDFDAMYKEGSETRKKMGVDTLIEWYQSEVDRYVAEWDAAHAE